VTPAADSRFTVLQALRGVAASLVVLFHLGNWEAVYWPANRMLEPVSWFGFAGVDLFFVVSGFTITWSHAREVGRPGAMRSYVARRLWRIYPTYWIAWLVCVVVSRTTSADWSTVLGPGEWRSFFLWMAHPVPHRQLPPAWSLVYEMIFYTVFGALLLAPPRVFLPVLVGWAAAAWLQASHPLRLLVPLADLLLYPLVIEFVLGCIVALAVRSGSCRAERSLVAIGLAVCLLGVVLQRRFGSMDNLLWRVACFGGGAAFLVAGLTSGELRGRWRSPRWLARVGDASYSTFLSHWPAFILTMILLPGMLSSPPPKPLLIAFLLAVLQGSGFVMYRLVEKPLTSMGRSLFSPRAAEPRLSDAERASSGAAMRSTRPTLGEQAG